VRVDRVLGGCGIPKDSVAGRREFERMVEARRGQESGEAFAGIRRGWCLGDEVFRQELLERVSAKAGPQHYGAELAQSAEAKAERIVAEELARHQWKPDDLVAHRKGDPKKVAMAVRLRRETTMTVAWIAARLRMGTKTHLAHLLYWNGRGRGKKNHDTIDGPQNESGRYELHPRSAEGCPAHGEGGRLERPFHARIPGLLRHGAEVEDKVAMNRSVLSQFIVFTLLAGGTLTGLAETSDSSGLPSAATKHWTADNGNGTYSNPLFYEEFEDPDIIRVGENYYLAGTTMHMMPAVQIMHSKDLVNWELVGYCMDRLDLGPAFRLEGGNIYGRGIWAPCIRYYKGTFYIFSNVNGVGLQVFRSKTINGPWERNQLPGRHDMSVLFDDDDKVYIISGAGSPYPIEELTPDLRAFNTNAPKRALVGRMGEGHHLYKINGKYVDVSANPGGPVDQMVAIADSIDGPWKVERMVQSESLGVTAATPLRAQANDRGLWLHQGGMVDTPAGEWWSIIMSDHGSAGRMVSLVPITWDNGFPLIGLPGNLRKAPNTWLKPNTGHTQEPKPIYVWDENFDGLKLNPHAQWNHVPDDTKLVPHRETRRVAPAFAAREGFLSRPQQPVSAATRTGVPHDGRVGHHGTCRGRHRRTGAAEFAIRLDRRGEDSRGQCAAIGHWRRWRTPHAPSPRMRGSRWPIWGRAAWR